MAVIEQRVAEQTEEETLRARVAELEEALARETARADEAEARLAAAMTRLHTFERELLELKKRVIGRTTERSRRKDEKRPPSRPKNDAEAQDKRKRNRQARNKLLPTERVEHPVDDDARSACPSCTHEELVAMPGEVSSEYEYLPGRLVRRLHIREKLRCTSCGHMVRAAAPPRVVDGGHYGPGFIARTVVRKCADAMPLNRQVEAYRRDGLEVARSTLVGLFHAAAQVVEPLYERLCSLVVAAYVVYADETSLKMQQVEKLGYIWTFACDDAVIYRYSEDRSGDTPVALLGDSSGLLVVDGYTGYNHVTTPERRKRGGCNSHSRRKFVDIDDEGAAYVIAQYKEVFAADREAKALGILRTPAHLELRRTRAGPAMEAIKRWCDEHAGAYSPKSPMGKAIGYVRNQWECLTLFLDHVEIDPHNNWSERLLRILAIGRKNWLFVGHASAGQNTAMLMSLIATCKLHGVNPVEYLTDILVRVADHKAARIDELLPRQWKAARTQPG